MVRIVITIGIVIIFLSGCSSMSAMAQPGLPGNTQDLFWCAAFDPISNTVYAIDYDMVLGDWEINLINNDALPINWRPQQHGWAIDNEGRGYYAYTTTLGNIAIMANNTNNYQLDATWALAFQLTTYTPYLNFDLESRDDWIYGLTYNTVTTPNNLCSFRYDTANGIFGELILLNPVDPLTIFTMTLDDTLMGLIHYTYYILDYEAPGWNYLYYDQVQPFGLNATLAPEIVTPGGISTPRDWCMILSDNDNYLWVFETDEADMIYIYEYYKHFGFGTQWNYGSGPSRSSCWWKNAWAACHRPPDNTIHFVAISFIDNGATGDYYLCYNRRTANDWYLDAQSFITMEIIRLVGMKLRMWIVQILISGISMQRNIWGGNE